MPPTRAAVLQADVDVFLQYTTQRVVHYGLRPTFEK